MLCLHGIAGHTIMQQLHKESIIRVIVYTPTIPLSNPYNIPVYNPPIYPPLRSLGYRSEGDMGTGYSGLASLGLSLATPSVKSLPGGLELVLRLREILSSGGGD